MLSNICVPFLCLVLQSATNPIFEESDNVPRGILNDARLCDLMKRKSLSHAQLTKLYHSIGTLMPVVHEFEPTNSAARPVNWPKGPFEHPKFELPNFVIPIKAELPTETESEGLTSSTTTTFVEDKKMSEINTDANTLLENDRAAFRFFSNDKIVNKFRTKDSTAALRKSNKHDATINRNLLLEPAPAEPQPNVNITLNSMDNCVEKGSPQPSTAYIHLCTVCYGVRDLGEDYFPRVFFEQKCKSGEKCTPDSGMCLQGQMTIEVLHKQSSQCEVEVHDNEMVAVDVWNVEKIKINSFCECAIVKSNLPIIG